MNKRSFIILLSLLATTFHGLTQSVYSNIEFVENKGQWDRQVSFKGDIPTGAFFLQRNGFTVLLNDTDELRSIMEEHGVLPQAGGQVEAGNMVGSRVGSAAAVKTSTAAAFLHGHAYRVSFIGASPDVEIIPDKPLPTYNNYFIGNDPSKWASHCRVFLGVTYKNIYPNVDIRYYTDKGLLKYDIIVHPGGDVSQIAMRYEGTDRMSIKKSDLSIQTSVGEVKELAPLSYQFDERGRAAVQSKYILKDNIVRFKIGDHTAGATLIIDPTLSFCSFSGSRTTNWGFTATPGPGGSFIAGGIIFANGFPVTAGAFQTNFKGKINVAIMKFNPFGTNVDFATYLGGNDMDIPHSMICDPAGDLIVLGHTYSTDFPFQTLVGTNSIGSSKIYVVKFSPDGTRLLGSMRIGGSGNDGFNIADQRRGGTGEHAMSLIRNYGDDSRAEVVLDGANNILVAASTQSPNDFPVTPGAFQQTFGGGTQDGVVLKINPACNAVIWSSYLGGEGDDAAFVLKPDLMTGDIYVGGATTSMHFPGDMTNVIQNTYGGGTCDGFLTVINSDGTQQKKSTYLGTDAADAIYGIQIDKSGAPYVMGTTNGSWPVINAGYSNPGSKQFVAKIQPSLQSYIYSTVFGSPSALPNISPVAFLVDRCENVYISGWGGWIFASPDPYGLAGTLGMPTTPDAIQQGTDNRDFYFIVLKKDVTGLLYGTFFGQEDNASTISEHVDGGTSRYDQNGIIYQAICANCGGTPTKPFPTTPHVVYPLNGTGNSGCNLAAVKIAFNFAGVTAGIKASVNGHVDDTSGCVPLDAQLQDTVRNAKSYIWNFGDGSPDTTTAGFAVEHTYANVGQYLVTLIAIDSTSCNERDTTYRHIIARNDRAPLNFDYLKDGPCQSLTYSFNNLSTFPPGKPFGDSSFVWIFGDLPAGSNVIPGGAVSNTITHTFLSPGTYIVSLALIDTNYCNYPDTLAKTLRISPLTKAQFTTPPFGCVPYAAVFNNSSLGGEQFFWDFGDGQTSTDPSPTHVYADTGTYTIHLTVIDTTTCNKSDSTLGTIMVKSKPQAALSAGPIPPLANTPMIFTNRSTGGDKFQWIFGDGATETKNTTDTAMHLYDSTGVYQACLVAFNQYGCSDTACTPIQTLIDPLCDVPNAFTPGRFGQDGIIKVAGFGITHMIFRIYNRWGQLVFQSNDPNIGWDGTFKGNPQPMDVYNYTLEAEFSNGKTARKTGNITLIR